MYVYGQSNQNNKRRIDNPLCLNMDHDDVDA